MWANRCRASARPIHRSTLARPHQARTFRSGRSLRDATDTAKSSANSAASHTPAILAGVGGGVSVFFAAYLWYHFSGAKTIVQTSNQAQAYFKNAFKQTANAGNKDNGDAIQWLKETVHSYTKMVPGASAYVDKAFDDIEKVRDTHKDEVDKIMNDTKSKLSDITNKPVSFERVGEVWAILSAAISQIGKLAPDVAQQLLDNHPTLKKQVGGKIEQLKQMGDAYGPEAKKAVDNTWSEATELLNDGFSMGTISKIQDLVQRKTQELQKYGDKAWEKGMEAAKPVLDKAPELKEMVEKNKSSLLQGDLGKLWEIIQSASKSGDTEELKEFVQQQKDKVQERSSGGLSSLLSSIPGGGKIGSNISQLSELSSKYGKEVEDLFKSTMKEVGDVLDKKVDEGQQLKDKLESEAKK